MLIILRHLLASNPCWYCSCSSPFYLISKLFQWFLNDMVLWLSTRNIQQKSFGEPFKNANVRFHLRRMKSELLSMAFRHICAELQQVTQQHTWLRSPNAPYTSLPANLSQIQYDHDTDLSKFLQASPLPTWKRSDAFCMLLIFFLICFPWGAVIAAAVLSSLTQSEPT